MFAQQNAKKLRRWGGETVPPPVDKVERILSEMLSRGTEAMPPVDKRGSFGSPASPDSQGALLAGAFALGDLSAGSGSSSGGLSLSRQSSTGDVLANVGGLLVSRGSATMGGGWSSQLSAFRSSTGSFNELAVDRDSQA
mmetsp:Transcript_38075/g.74400  ORF Transcript_38075/g.74400 Transcript_38075/m.74400 type:complete len:139 (+) Transcript_38075:276-692(+)|eukprot:CAMPEP_0173380250 /NCGR_PEP_ID=MMETSP1356-20130122/2960_1 /TAXON_ID=77927 ORGANISM="Hemiselmis virescens, Strain PCC157" /NCGR_SAMPLE_ID=MMETSP1356 /ASSEMBLY_ACC=CAM_ASM_000847 /LENGTH=138 /DNA_ID=CAMNT_0014333777 /DNA_START=269 /DNA_END=685 /DNA_ORIENTATION=+